MHNIEANDQIVIRFPVVTAVEVFESADFELDEPVEEIFSAGDTVEVDVFDINQQVISIQFGDGSVAFLPHSSYEVVSINDEPINN